MKEYQKPEFSVAEYETELIVAMSWSDEETDEALVGGRSDASTDWEESFWEGRE
ncbi:MAG: hypothetical protein IKP43_02130 [Bacteroidaceae bacterium]|jgi:hypothetical protein|nr:hypothetical protein [Bacteroidaceae bacterium]